MLKQILEKREEDNNNTNTERLNAIWFDNFVSHLIKLLSSLTAVILEFFALHFKI